ncbi:hypothetical protein TPA0907_10620 [Micromonospora humidisoli]|nr:hypothetical protein TPA0907_10620 [Micromonospora sp. AKA109]
MFQEEPQVAGINSTEWSDAMQSLLKCHIATITMPDGAAADISALTDEEITRANTVAFLLLGRDIHSENVRNIDPTPLHIDVPQIRA